MAIAHVDPTNGDDGTGDGSSGSPYASVQGALDNFTFDTAAPNTIRLANTSADVLSSTLSFATHSPGQKNPLTIAGWDNGGSLTATGPWGQTFSNVGEIDGNDAVANIVSLQAYLSFYRIKMHGTTSYCARFGANSTITECEIYDVGSTYAVRAPDRIYNSYIHDTTNMPSSGLCYQSRTVLFSELKGGASGYRALIGDAIFANNLVHGFSNTGIEIDESLMVSNNTVDGTGSGASAIGISANSAQEGCRVFNNLVTNFSGSGAVAISLAISGAGPTILGNNAFYNNTTDVSSDTGSLSFSNVTESSDPYTNAASGDYSLNSGASSIGAAIITNADPDNPDNIGAWQDYSSGGGGATPGMTAHVTVA